MYTIINAKIRHHLIGTINSKSIWNNLTANITLKDLMEGSSCQTAFQSIALAIGYQIGFQEGKDSKLSQDENYDLENAIERLINRIDSFDTKLRIHQEEISKPINAPTYH